MLNFTVRAGEYFNIGDDIRVVILGGCANNCRVMVDAPREYNIVRGRVLERNAVTEEEKEKLGRYYPQPKLPPEAIRRMIARQRQEPDVRKEAGNTGSEAMGQRSKEKNGSGTMYRKGAKSAASGLMQPGRVEKAAGQ